MMIDDIECPCANHHAGWDTFCPDHGDGGISYEGGIETALNADDQYDADMSLLWPIWADELGVSA